MDNTVPEGTRRIIDGRERVFYSDYWVKTYNVPEDTLQAKRKLIGALTRRLFNHVEHGLNIPGSRLNEARKSYEDAVKTYEPGRGYPAVQEALKRVDGRLVSLSVNRNSVDAIQTDPTNAIEQYSNTIEALLKVNQEISRTITEPNLARDFQSFVNMQAIGYNRSKEAMYATAVVAVGYYPQQFPTTSAPEPTEGGSIFQGFLEGSNVNPVAEITRMIAVQRAYEMGQGFLDAEDGRIRSVVQTIGR